MARHVSMEMDRTARASSAFERAKVIEAAAEGQWLVQYSTGAQIKVPVASPCFTPATEMMVDISNINGLRAIEGPSGYG